MVPLVLLLLASPVASGNTVPPSDGSSCPGNVPAFAYNGFFSGAFEAQSSDVQGRLAAGGNIKLNNYAIADRLTASGAGDSLIAGGDLSFSSGRLYFGNAVVAGSANVGQPVRAGLAPGQSIRDHAVLPIDFAAAQAQIERLSWLLTLLPVSGTYQARYGGLYLRGASSGALQVFDLPGDLVMNANTFDVQGIPSGATVVFNVRGATTGLKNVGLQSLASIRSRVVFNFPEATSLTFSSVGIEGSVIAPKAVLSNPQGNINGSIFAKSFKGPMQLNHYPFVGCLKVNQAPAALGRDLRTPEDTPISIQLTGTDPDRDPLRYSVVSNPSHGTLSGTAPNLVYAPAAQYNGEDVFTFRVNDGKENSAIANVRITVTPVNDRPTAVSQSLSTPEDTALRIQLGGADVEDARLAFHVLDEPQHGTLSGDGASLVYTPEPNFSGEDGFGFVSNDGELDSALATVTVLVTPVNDAPTANAQVLETGANTVLPIVLTGADPDGDVLTFQIVEPPAHGSLSGSGANLSYVPAPNYRGPDRFSFATDDGELFSDPAVVSITVIQSNQPPSIVSAAVESGSEVDGYQYDVEAQDPDGDPLAYAIDRSPEGLVIDPTTGLVFGALDAALVQPVRAFNKHCFVIPNDATLPTPAALEHLGEPDLSVGRLRLERTAGGFALSAEVENRGLADVAGTSTLRFVAGRALDGPPLGDVTVPPLRSGEGTWVSIPVDSEPMGGVTAVVTADEAIEECIDDNNFSRAALVQVRASDPFGLFATQSFLVNLEDSNSPPEITSEPVTELGQGLTYDYQVTVKDRDVGDSHEFQLTTAPAGLFIDELSGRLGYASELTVGTHDVVVEVTDLRGASVAQSFRLTVRPNAAPAITSTPIQSADPGVEYVYDVEASDADGDVLTYALGGAPAGMIIDPTTGLIRWTPPLASLVEVIAVVVTDGRGGSVAQVFALESNLTPNHAPVITSTPPAFAYARVSYRYDIEASDPDGDALTYELVEAPSGMSIDFVTGRVQWTPEVYGPSARVTVLVRDTHGAETRQAFTVGSSDRSPMARDDAYEVRAGETLNVTAPGVLANDTDPDGLPLSANLVTPPTQGTLELRPNGSFTYAPQVKAPDPGPFAARLEWAWALTAGTAQPPFTPARFGSPQVDATPMVADLDGDGAPEIIVPSRYHLVILSGRDGHVRFFTEGADIKEVAAVAVGDLEGDGRPDIVALSSDDGPSLLAFDGNGALKWESASTVPSQTQFATQLALADVDGDGTAEIVVPNGPLDQGVALFNFDGTLRWRSVAKGSGNIGYGNSSPIIADIDLDGVPEIIGGQTVYANDGTVKWSADSIGDGAVAIGNFDSDPYAEIVLVHAEALYVLEHDGRVKWGPVRGPTGGAGSGPPMVADLDGDGAPEIGITGKDTYSVFETDGSVKWQVPIGNKTNSGIGANGSSVFDFDGDGVPEIVHQNWDTLFVLRGTDGVLLWSTPLGRGFAYPVIADVDGDGEAEILAGSAGGALDPGGGFDGGLYVFGSATGKWAPARKIWNQYSYHVTNVLANGGIPAHEQPNWLLPNLNNYRAAAFLPEEAPELVDGFAYVASDGTLESSATPVRIRVRPRNSAPRISGTPPLHAVTSEHYAYAVRVSDPDPGDTFTYALTDPPAGMTVSPLGVVDWTPTASQLGDHQVILGVTDSSGRSGFQVYTLTVRLPDQPPENNRAPRITSAPLRQIVVGNAYRYAVQAFDPDGDPVTYRLLDGPSGMSIDAASGLVVWPGQATRVGQHAVALEVSDGLGGVATQSFDIEVNGAATNLPPDITSQPVFAAKVGRTYSYVPTAVDPDGDPLTWSLASSLPGMTVNPETGAISWVPASAGSFTARLRVSDGLMLAEQAWSIHVVSAEVVLTGELQISPTVVLPGETFQVGVSVDGEAGPVTLTATLDGEPFALASNTNLVLEAPSALGAHCIAIDIADDYESKHLQSCFVVADPSDTDHPVVHIDAPREGASQELLVVTAPEDVIASVDDDNLTRWTVTLQEQGAPSSEAVEIARGSTPISSVPVGKLDPTMLRNGLYTLALTGEDEGGHRSEDRVLVSIEGSMKLGNFSLSFEDLKVPVAGLPITVTRTYDTRERGQKLDFGYGWSVDYTSVRLQESRVPGYAWTLTAHPSGPLGLIPNWCIESALGNVVSVTLPDGGVEKFRAVAFPECNQGVPFVDVELRFEPLEGTQGKLEALNYSAGLFVNDQLTPLDAQGPLDPSEYRYTNAQGQEFTIDQFFGLRKIEEREIGSTVTFSRDGVIHSTGYSIAFQRDSQGRIVSATAPDNSQIHYEYTPEGDLGAVVDANGNRTEFTYVRNPDIPPHYLQDIMDPRGVRVSRNEYDDDGHLIAVVDANDQRIEYDRDIDGRVERVKNRNGFTTTYLYNSRGDVLVETNPLGNSVNRTYDVNGNTLSQTDALGRTKRWTYDSLGNVLTQTDPSGSVTRNSFGAFNQLNTVTNAANVVVLQMEYKNATFPGTGIVAYPGPLSHVTDANGKTFDFFYEKATGVMDLIVAPTGAQQRIQVDQHGYTIADIDALGQRTEYVNDAMGRVLEKIQTFTNAQGQTQTLSTRYTRDAKGNVLATEHPDGSITTMAYDANDRVVEECDALGRCTSMEYDALGTLALVTHPDGSTERSSYDASGNLLSETDRLGRTTRYVYDAANRVIETIHPDDTPGDQDNPRERNGYDGAGQLIETIDANGNVTNYEYDLDGRPTKVILPAVDGQRAEIVTEYDAAGNRTRVIDPNGHATRFEYDAKGTLTRTISASIAGEPDATVTTDFDALGRKIAETDASGRIVRFASDARDQLVRVVLPNPSTGANPPLVNGQSPDSGTLTTSFAYDELGNKVRQIDAEGRITRWEYDGMGRELARILPGGQREENVYNEAGELVAHKDFNGKTTQFGYDAVGRLASVTYADGVVHGYAYNAGGERTRIRDGRGESTVSFDAGGHVIQSTDARGARIDYRYDPVGNLVERTSPHQRLTYAYDARNRLQSVTRTSGSEAPLTTRYGYDAKGNRSLLVGADGTRTEYAYDARDGLRGLRKHTRDGALLNAALYQLDRAGRRTRVEESDAGELTRTVDYAYDGSNRIRREAIDHVDALFDRDSTWTYDRVGNRLTQSVLANGAAEVTHYTYDANDRLSIEATAGSTTSYTYDANGNTLGKSGPGVLVAYTYDDAGRLVEARSEEGTSRYVYDGNGLLVERLHTPANGNPLRTYYLEDSTFPYARVLEELSQQGAEEPWLSATHTLADEPLGETRYTIAGTASHGFTQLDGFGSTRWLTDSEGALTDSLDYDAFGNALRRAGTTELGHLYRGEPYDPHAELYYLRARWMDPKTGRFTQQDTHPGSSRDPLSLDKYLYAASDPINYSDPSGQFTLQELNISQEIQTVIREQVKGWAKDQAIEIVTRTLIGLPGLGEKAAELVPKIGSVLGVAIVSTLALECKSVSQGAANSTAKKRGCLLAKLGVPTLINGLDTPFTTGHILGALLGFGKTKDDKPIPLPFILVRNTRDAVYPRRGEGGCDTDGTNKDCDEYPFGATFQGGNANWNAGRVSLLYVPSSDNRSQGSKLGVFYRHRAAVAKPGGVFLNIAIPWVKTSWIEPGGNWEEL